MTTRKEHHEAVTELLDHHSESLTTWEEEFLTSLSDRLDRGFSLTAKQEAKLDELWRHHMG